MATAATPALADEPNFRRVEPSTRGGRPESELRAPPPAATAVPTPAPAPAEPPPPPTPTVGDKIVGLAAGMLGSPYAFGGASPVTGFDCSGLVYWALEQLGINVGRTADAQFGHGEPVPPDQLQPGDLVFFSNTYMRGLSHVGVYLGDGQFVDAGTERTGVRRANLGDPYWAARFTGARRIR